MQNSKVAIFTRLVCAKTTPCAWRQMKWTHIEIEAAENLGTLVQAEQQVHARRLKFGIQQGENVNID